MKLSLVIGVVGLLISGFLFFPVNGVQASGGSSFDPGFSANGAEHCSDLKVAVAEKPGITQESGAAVLQGAALSGAARAEMNLSQDSLQTGTSIAPIPVKVETITLFSSFLDGTERIAQVYLPGGYTQDSAQQYPVLYALDGQQLPDINFSQTLSDLFASGEVMPFITVAVFTTDGDQRREELGTGTTLNFFGWGTQSDAFNHYIVQELVPKINATYRVLPGPQNSAVMGWSLGGLTSFYLAWQYPDTFGQVGAFSPSFWWRNESLPGQELQARVIPNLVQASPARPDLKMWFEAGTKELPYSDVDGNGVIDMIQDVQDVMGLLSQKGYQDGANMVYVQVEGGQHELSTWETVLPDFLRFAFTVT